MVTSIKIVLQHFAVVCNIQRRLSEWQDPQGGKDFALPSPHPPPVPLMPALLTLQTIYFFLNGTKIRNYIDTPHMKGPLWSVVPNIVHVNQDKKIAPFLLCFQHQKTFSSILLYAAVVNFVILCNFSTSTPSDVDALCAMWNRYSEIKSSVLKLNWKEWPFFLRIENKNWSPEFK